VCRLSAGCGRLTITERDRRVPDGEDEQPATWQLTAPRIEVRIEEGEVVMSQSAAIHEHSEQFLPAFARLRAGADGKLGRYAPLDFHFQGTTPRPSPGEREVKRWVVIGGCLFVATREGMPLDTAPAGSSGVPLQLFYGGAEIVLTDKRVLGIVSKGDTVVGDVGSGSMLLFSYPLARIGSVDLDLKRRMFGGLKETRLHIMSMDGTVSDLFIDDVIAEPGGNSRGYQRFAGTKRDILEAFVAPVVAAHRAAPDPDEQQLARAEKGVRDERPDGVSVEFAS